MFSQIRKIGVAILLGMILAACGDEGGSGGPAPQAVVENGACSDTFRADFNQLMSFARTLKNETDLRQLRSKAKQFQSKYSGVKCRAMLHPADGSAPHEGEIDVNAITTKLISVVDKALKGS